MTDTQLIDAFQRARKADDLAIIEGVQAAKHAVRFEAEVHKYITYDINSLQKLLAEIAEDVKNTILENIAVVDEQTFNKLSPQPPRTGLIAMAQRRNYLWQEVAPNRPVVFLEDPRDLENIGAVIRVAAAADAAAVIISGSADIWHPAVIRGAAGLHWAIPVFDNSSGDLQQNEKSISEMLRSTQTDRKLIALDPTGDDINDIQIPKSSILIFGTERHGISKKLLAQSDEIVRLPMKKGVSSLNLATSVAATLYQL